MSWSASHPEHPDYAAHIECWEPFAGRIVYMYSYTKGGLHRSQDWAPTLAAAKRRVAKETWAGWRWKENPENS